MYISDDGEVLAVRVGDYKSLSRYNAPIRCGVGGAVREASAGNIINLRRDPFERAEINSKPTWTG